MPTASYMAYANDHNHLDGETAEMLMGRLLVYQQGDLYLQEHRELGYSLYDSHADGSGVCYSSRLRPVLNMRPKYASWLGAHGSGLWQFNADTHLIDWLEHEGVAVDFITDEDLEKEGVGAARALPRGPDRHASGVPFASGCRTRCSPGSSGAGG